MTCNTQPLELYLSSLQDYLLDFIQTWYHKEDSSKGADMMLANAHHTFSSLQPLCFIIYLRSPVMWAATPGIGTNKDLLS